MTAPSAGTPTDTGLANSAIVALRNNHEELAARVRGFDDSDLTRQSRASEWAVAKVLSHLGSGARSPSPACRRRRPATKIRVRTSTSQSGTGGTR